MLRIKTWLGAVSGLVPAVLVTGALAAGPIDDAPATGTLTIWAVSGEGDRLGPHIDQFIAANPGLKVDITVVPSSDIVTKLQTAIAAGTTPDMTYLFTQLQSSVLRSGSLAPVPDGLVDPSAFFDAAWVANTVDGVAYAVPWFVETSVLFYNRDYVKAGGLALPATWDDYAPFLKGLMGQGAEQGLALDVGWGIFTAAQITDFVRQNGGWVLNADESRWTLDDPKVVEAVEFYASLYRDGLTSPDGPTFLNMTGDMVSGRVGAIMMGPFLRAFADGAAGAGWTDQHLGVVTLPAGPGGTSAGQIGGGNFMVFKDARNADAAWKFIRFMVEPDTQASWYAVMSNLPSVKSVWDREPLASDEMLKAFKQQLETAAPNPTVSTWNQVADVLGKAVEQVVRGNMSAADALAEAQAQADSIGVGN